MRLARCHFEIIRILDEQDESHYFIRDLDSHCGIYLNGQNGIGTSENWAQLQHGDKILFDFEFSFSDLSGTIPKAGFSYKNSFIIAER